MSVRFHFFVRMCGFVGQVLFLTCFQTFAQTQSFTGVVRDTFKAPIAKAHVVLTDGNNRTRETETGGDGVFEFSNWPAVKTTLTVTANGFAPAKLSLETNDFAGSPIEIVLMPAPVNERVVITAQRSPIQLGETAASVRVVSSADFETTAALTVDDALRQVPGFQLFRRSGSRTANPTSQGVSLRGVGASGASRALVLFDGIPLNDPFGGWVYWDRAPREVIDRIEVVRGAASDLYGSGPLGGVVGVISKSLDQPLVDLEASYGNERTPSGSAFFSARRGKFGFGLAGETMATTGYVVVPEDQRGPIDTVVNVRHSVSNLRLAYDAATDRQIVFRASYFREARSNGTPVQTNRTHIRDAAAGIDWSNRVLGSTALRVYTAVQLFDQNFSAIAANRNSESITRLQRVPAQVFGVTFQTTRPLGSKHALVGGTDAREVRGASNEIAYVAGRPTSLLGAGGRGADAGVFAKDIFRPVSKLTIVGGGRFDYWRNYQAHSDTQPVAPNSITAVATFADRSETAFSPQVSVLYRPGGNVSVFGSGYRAFRAPTLNELYRSFRVGNVLTLANERLRAERLTGAEAGVATSFLNERGSLRGSYFWSEINSSIANVTLTATPALITRQRKNLGSTRSRGVELDSEVRLSKYWNASAGYLFVDSVVATYPVNIALEGLRIPQVPRHSFTFGSQYIRPSILTFAVQGRVIGDQFDDDLNTFRLPGFFTLDLYGSRRFNSRYEMFLAVENAFGNQYMTGRTPVVTLGPPRLLRIGFRVHWQKK